MYFEVLNFLEQKKIEDPTRWFSRREIEYNLLIEYNFSDKALKRALKKLKKYHKVFCHPAPKERDIKATFMGKGLYLYKLNGGINEIAHHRANAF